MMLPHNLPKCFLFFPYLIIILPINQLGIYLIDMPHLPQALSPFPFLYVAKLSSSLHFLHLSLLKRFGILWSLLKVFFEKSLGGESSLKTDSKLLIRSPCCTPSSTFSVSQTRNLVIIYSSIVLSFGHFGISCSA